MNGEMTMKVLYEERDGGIRILRCCGADNGAGERGTIVLPASICGKPVTELGNYLFSADMREAPKGVLWDEEQETERGSAGAPAPELCGSRVRAVYLPSSLRRIGNYAFYNCDGLRELHFCTAVSDIGAGAFNGCRKITDLYADVYAGEKSCLKEILAELNETLTVHYREFSPGEREEETENNAGTNAACRSRKLLGEARLLFPLFYEEAVENTPARILETHVHGCGHRYRYCFQGTEFKFREYDSLFLYARAQEEPEQAVKLAVGRLRWPYQLSREAELEYAAYLLSHLEYAGDYLLKEGGTDGLKWLLETFAPENGCDERKNEHATAGCLGNEGSAVRAREEYYDIKKPVLGETGFDKLMELANRAGYTEAVSFLMDQRYRYFPPKRKRFAL